VSAPDVPADLRDGAAHADAANRLIAYGIDLVLLTVVVLAAAVVVSVVLGPTISFDPAAENLSGAVTVHRGLAAVNAVVGTALSGVYFVLSWWRRQATPGQRLLRLRIWHAAGGTVPVRAAVLRWVLLGAPFALASGLVLGSGVETTLLWLLALVWDLALLVTTARDPRGRGLHDQASGTTVVKVLAAPPPRGG
jgi:uncharacterized RDD family membrane protein YckC